MVKRIIALVLFLTILSSCAQATFDEEFDSISQNTTSNNESSAVQEFEVSSEKKFLDYTMFPILIEDCEKYQVYSNKEKTGYYYIIFDNCNSVLDEGYCSYKFNGIKQQESLLELTYGSVGGPHFYARYYDLENNKVSRLFDMPVGTTDDVVAYFTYIEDGVKLVVQNMFDQSVLYYTITDDTFSASVLLYKCTAIIDKTNHTISVTYPHTNFEKDTEMITKTFSF